MIVHTPADLGAAIRARRKELKLGQEELAATVGVQRQWVVKIESGKTTAEVGLVLRTLAALGLELEVKGGRDRRVLTRTAKPPAGISYDIESALKRTRPPQPGVLSAVEGKHRAVLSKLAEDIRRGRWGSLAQEGSARKKRRR